MSNGRIAVAIMIFIPLVSSLVVTAASAQTLCTQEFLERVDAEQPAVIIVREGEAVADAIEKSYGCSFESFRPGATVYSESGEELGEITAFGAEGDSENVVAYLDVGGFLGMGAKPVAVPLNDFSSYNNAGIIASVSTDTVRELPASAWENSDSTVFTSETGENMLAGLARAKLSVSSFFLPPKRVHVIFASNPAAADVYMEDVAIDETEVELIIRQSELTKIELRKAGFKSCPFGDGNFEEGNRMRPSYFFCALTQSE